MGVLVAASCGVEESVEPGPQPGAVLGQQEVELLLPTGDGAGHGPDRGSLEWRSVVEFKLGIRGDPAIPARDTDEWCTYIDERIRSTD